MYYCVFWLNSFPSTGVISNSLSPQAIAYCWFVYRLYPPLSALVWHMYASPCQNHTTGVIILCPTGNQQEGGYHFFSLKTGRILLNRNHWTVFPMPADVIDCVHIMSPRCPDTNTSLEFGTHP